MNQWNKQFETNKKLWDAKTPFHLKSELYDLENFKKGKNSLDKIVLEGLKGEVEGKSILHLQCHFGQDSLSLARMGAKVTGMDLSPAAIETARNLNEELGLDVEFVVSNVYDLKNNLNRQFDIVFTSYGAITWLPDLVEWASIIDHFLKPGGTFFIAEFHPYFYTFDWDTLNIAYNYFNSGQPYEEAEEGTYADPNAKIKLKEYFWCHSLMEVMQPLLKTGMQVVDFQEFDYSPYNAFPNVIERAPGEFVWKTIPQKVPYVFSLKMKKS